MRQALLDAKADLKERGNALAAAKESLADALRNRKKLAEKHKQLCDVRDEWSRKKFGRVVKMAALEKHLRGRKKVGIGELAAESQSWVE